MSDFNDLVSGIPGGANLNGPGNSNAFGNSAGQPSTEDLLKQNEELSQNLKSLETKLGSMGKELGDYRGFFEGISPLLTTLDKNPEIVQAILDGKIDTDLAKAASEGRLSVSDAQLLTQAHADVKKDMGTKAYNAASTEDIAKLVQQEVQAAKKEFDTKLRETEESRIFENSVNEFIASTPDFADYAKEIGNWLDEHDITDIKVAYYAVKGQISDREARKMASENAAEMAKQMAGNAAGGGSRATYIQGGENVIDSLIGGKSNPNVI